MHEDELVLADAPLVPDPDAGEEMGPTDAAAIADAELAGSRLLLVRRAAEPVRVGDAEGGAVQLACTFQPAPGSRFRSARLALRLATPDGVRLVDVGPEEVRDERPVRFTVNRGGKLELSYEKVAEAGVERGVKREYETYHCTIRGSGAGTGTAVWTFEENPHTRGGLGTAQVLALTLPVVGRVTGTVTVSASLARPGLRGGLEAIRDLVLGPKPEQRHYGVAFEIPRTEPADGDARFFRIA